MRITQKTLWWGLLCAVLGLMLLFQTAGHSSAATSSSNGMSDSPVPTITPGPDLPPVAPDLGSTGQAVGVPAIKPSGNSIPAYSTDDLANYVNDHPLPGAKGKPTIVRKDFINSDELILLVKGLPLLRQPGTPLGYVEFKGSFTFTGDTTSYQYGFAWEVFDAQTGNLLGFGGLDGQTPTNTPSPNQPTATPAPNQPTATPKPGQPTATPKPTSPPQATATATPQPVLKFSIKPTTAQQSCGSSAKTVLPALTITLDNVSSTIPVTWHTTITDTLPSTSTVWATTSPTSGTIPAGSSTVVTITPNADTCLKMQSTASKVYTVNVVYSSSLGGGTIIFADTVSGPIVG